jgi:PKD repeat protein
VRVAIVVAIAGLAALGISAATSAAAATPPVARITATPTTGTVPLNVTFDAGGSSDADGRIVTYKFDFDNATANVRTTSPIASSFYTKSDGYKVAVTVTDDSGLTATASVSVKLSAVAPSTTRPASTTTPASTTRPPATSTTTPPASASDIWVAPAGSNSASGTSSAPLKTVGAALAKAAPGVTIHVLPGTYAETLTAATSGRADAPITLRAEGRVVLAGSTKSGRVLSVLADDWVIEGFDITGRDNGVWLQGAHGVVLRNNEIHDLAGECVRVKYLSTANVIERNSIHDCGLDDFVRNPGTGKNGEGVYIGTAPEQLSRNPTPVPDASNANIVRDNVVVTNGNECVDIKEGATANVVEFNDCTGQKDPESAGFDARGSGNVFRYNVSHDNVGGGVRVGGDGVTDGVANDIIGNVLAGNLGYGIKAIRTPQGTVCGNTIVGNGSGAISDKSVQNPACPSLTPTPGPRP